MCVRKQTAPRSATTDQDQDQAQDQDQDQAQGWNNIPTEHKHSILVWGLFKYKDTGHANLLIIMLILRKVEFIGPRSPNDISS